MRCGGDGRRCGDDQPELATRLSKGQKRNRKLLAEVATVDDVILTPRTPAEILPVTEQDPRGRGGTGDSR